MLNPVIFWGSFGQSLTYTFCQRVTTVWCGENALPPLIILSPHQLQVERIRPELTLGQALVSYATPSLALWQRLTSWWQTPRAEAEQQAEAILDRFWPRLSVTASTVRFGLSFTGSQLAEDTIRDSIWQMYLLKARYEMVGLPVPGWLITLFTLLERGVILVGFDKDRRPIIVDTLKK